MRRPPVCLKGGPSSYQTVSTRELRRMYRSRYRRAARSRGREQRYGYSLRKARRAQTSIGKANDDIEAKLKESTSPLSPEDAPDSVAVAQRVIDDNQEFEIFLQARTVKNNGKIGLKIISVSCRSSGLSSSQNSLD